MKDFTAELLRRSRMDFCESHPATSSHENMAYSATNCGKADLSTTLIDFPATTRKTFSSA